jgi:hypothetical protein
MHCNAAPVRSGRGSHPTRTPPTPDPVASIAAVCVHAINVGSNKTPEFKSSCRPVPSAGRTVPRWPRCTRPPRSASSQRRKPHVTAVHTAYQCHTHNQPVRSGEHRWSTPPPTGTFFAKPGNAHCRAVNAVHTLSRYQHAPLITMDEIQRAERTASGQTLRAVKGTHPQSEATQPRLPQHHQHN